MKNIRRCLKDPKPDKAALGATLVASASAIWGLVKAAGGTITGWDLIPLALALGAAVVGVLRFMRAGETDEHLKQAQIDADQLIVWQDEARVTVDREFQARALEAERARRAIPPKKEDT